MEFAEHVSKVVVGICRTCQTSYNALLRWKNAIAEDGSLQQQDYVLAIDAQDGMLTQAQDPVHGIVALHWERCPQHVINERIIDMYAGAMDMQDQGIITEGEVLEIVTRFAKDPERNDRETQCDALVFYSPDTGLPIRPPDRIVFSEEVRDWLAAGLI